MTPPRLSVVVIARDEEEQIRACLESVAWADELIVVDAESQDKTASIARELTDHVVIRPWPGFAAQKNYGLDLARGAWILSLDADETVSPALRAEIEAIVRHDGPHDGYEVPRRNIVWGRWIRHGGLYPDWQVRLFRRGAAASASAPCTSRAGDRRRRTAGGTSSSLVRDVADFLTRADRYSTLRPRTGARAGGPRLDFVLRPLGRFLGMYVVGRGFLDGWRGFLLAALYAYYVLIRSAKVWERTRA